MEFGFFDLWRLLGALAFFIFGMKIMSDGIQKASGSGLRKILSTMTKNRFFGVFTGFLITGIIQSSSATTVMTVSFVNAGLLTLVESAGIMMGANIGTTVTAWFISILGFKIKIVSIALPIMAIGLPMMFSKKSSLKAWGEGLIGFALLFIGLDELKHAVPDLKGNPDILQFLSSFSDYGMLSRLAFIGVGTVLTIVVQSSSAAMALTLVLCFNGVIPYDVAAAMVLGENIGTTITAELASLVANVHAKRSARIHSLFNLIGVTWMFFMLPVFLRVIDNFMIKSGMNSPFDDPSNIPYALSAFHTAFNFLNVMMLIGFSHILVKLAIRLVPSKGEDDEIFSLEYIGRGLLAAPELAIVEASKEVESLSKITKKSFDNLQRLVLDPDDKKFDKSLKKIKKIEDAADHIESEISKYLTTAVENGVSESTANRVKSLLEVSDYLESITDIIYSSSKGLERKKESKAYFTPDVRNNVNEMLELVSEAMDLMIHNIKNPKDVNLEEAMSIELKINQLRTSLRKKYISDIGNKEIKQSSGYFYMDLIQELERLGDYTFNVTETLATEE